MSTLLLVIWRRAVSRSWLGPSVVSFGLFVVLAAVLSGSGKLFGVCFVAALGWLVWHIYRRSLTLTIDMKDDDGRKILFDLKRGDFSGPSLPVQALNEMVESLKGMHNANKS